MSHPWSRGVTDRAWAVLVRVVIADAQVPVLPESGRWADDPATFRAIFAREHAGVVAALRRLCASRADAEDLAQETFIALGWHAFDRDRPHDVRAWLLRTAIRRALNQRRGDVRRVRRELAVAKPSTHGGAQEDFTRAQRVRAALLELDERSCQILVLRAIGSSYAEIAEVIGVKPSSIGTLLVRAQRRFVTHYEQGGHDGPVKEER